MARTRKTPVVRCGIGVVEFACGMPILDGFYGDLHATGKDGARFFTENKGEITRWFSE